MLFAGMQNRFLVGFSIVPVDVPLGQSPLMTSQ